ncbi:MAG: coenzyme F420-0:L-glutamate ligase [Oscillospiraceae bacterium]|jgi:F420-0:gamma-glutamyl ligase-like protein|nr:coenzyme F420-0:L-glutamate ligase [Oscillospiraceae bacterium]
MQQELIPNEGKSLEVTTTQGVFLRYPIKTHVVMKDDVLEQLLEQYVKPHIQPQDALYISEKIVAITQGRAFDIDDIKVSKLANLLCKFVYKSPYGIGLGSPWTMQLAIDDIGVPKILFAAFCSAVTKPFGMRGVFYKIVGDKGRAIDGPCDYTLPPYNHYAKLAPKDPNGVAARLSTYLGGNPVVIMDANDIGREVLGVSDRSVSIDLCKEIFRDNPLGQKDQCTPLCLVRQAPDTAIGGETIQQ